MNYWYVNIDYKKGPSFGMSVQAPDRQSAEYIAKREAEVCGFNEVVKKVTTRED